MDIDLLSKMVKELILDNDKVALPGLGSFVAEIVPSTFSDKGYTINPPYRRLYFRSRISEGDELVSFYAQTNNVDMEIAEKILTDFLAELRAVLFQKKTVVFPGLGRMRATKENTIFFVADEDLDIYPDGFALESISLKAHKETPEEVSGVMSELKAYIAEKPVETEEGPLDLDLPPVPEVQPEPESAPQVETEPQGEPESAPEVELVSESSPQSDVDVVQQPEPEDSVMKSETESVAPETTPMSVALAPEAETAPETAQEAETAPETKPDTEGAEEPKTVAETVVAAEIEPEAKPKKKRRPGKIFLIIFLSLLIAAVLLLVAFILVSRFCPEWLDSILYSAEELEVINYRNQ